MNKSVGSFTEQVLLAVGVLDGKAYGISVIDALEAATGKKPTIGTTYTTLERLEANGLVSSVLGDPSDSRGGKAKRFYSVTDAGRLALENAELVRAKLRKP